MKERMSRHRKRIGQGDIVGREGIHLIGLIAARMGLLWTERPAPEAGIDGFIEIRDSVTGEVFNTYVFVQSKAGKSYFRNETDSSFDYYADDADIEYWTSGNVPVVLVVSRDGKEAYWKALKGCFADPALRKDRKIQFNKVQDRFDETARSGLIALAESKDAGLYLSPIPKRERLFTNILPVKLGFDSVYLATTPLPSQAEFDRNALLKDESPSWAVYDGGVISFSDLSDRRFAALIDEGTVEAFSTEEFAEEGLQGRFIHLLNRCLRFHLEQFEIRYHERRERYYFESLTRGKPRVFSYQSIREHARREVVTWKSGKNPKQPGYCRHCAADLRFRNYDGDWFLEIVPDYIFTSDGYHSHSNSKGLLKGIKLLETNKAVVAQTLMWADLLAVDQGMFASDDEPLRFSRVIREEIPFGLSDKEWKPASAEESNEAAQEPLF